MLDMGHISNAFGNDPELTQDFLLAIKDNLPFQMGLIEDTLGQRDEPLNAAAAHQLKGLVSYFGHQSMLFQAQALQHSMEQKDRKASLRLYHGLKTRLNQLLDEIALEVNDSA